MLKPGQEPGFFTMDDALKYEKQARVRGHELIIGIDEAGRGPLAGPVVAAAVALIDERFVSVIRDSKKMSERQRERAYEEISQKAYIGIGIINESVIDAKNILEATFLAMNNAVRQLFEIHQDQLNSFICTPRKVCLLVDGNQFKPEFQYPYETIVGGDSLSLSVACASIIAKVTRDRILKIYDRIFPEYGFLQHKGYPTASHRKALEQFGISPIHRRSYRPVQQISHPPKI